MSLPRNCFECRKNTKEGWVRSDTAGNKCKTAHCVGDHPPEAGCDECPFERAGPEGLEMWDLFHMVAFRAKDEPWKMSHEGMGIVFDIYADPVKLDMFREIRYYVGLMNEGYYD